MRYPHILSAIRSAKWAVLPVTLQAIRDALSSRLAIDHVARPDASVATSPRRAVGAHYLAATQPSRVAVVPIFGIIGKRLSEFEMMCGGCDIEAVEQSIAEAVNDPQFSAVILHIDSPGGVVTGIPELAEKIRGWTGQKPVYAFTDGLCCSAAYWLASACDGVFCTPSSDIGSIGVYMALIDESANWAKDGYKLVLIKAGEHKADGMPGSQITEGQIGRWQAEVDEVYRMFTTAVTSARPDVKSESMQGQTFMGSAAVEALLADEVVPGIEALLAELLKPA